MDRVRDMTPGIVTVHPLAASATDAQLELAHSAEYVKGVLDGEIRNGFCTIDHDVTNQARACVGAMIQAVDLAIHAKTIVAVPCSGFHHASYGSGWGYCTFNGLVIAIAAERAKHGGKPRKVLIIDGDGHYGDGTDSCLREHAIKGIYHLTGPGLHHADWDGTIHRALRAEPWDLVLYQAGADAHRDDSYGVGYLDDDEWMLRDTMIFSHVAKMRIPTVFNFAGGYNGAQTVDLHYRTVRTALRYVLRYATPAAELKVAE
jgi:acetoin utilization deacetylase AcuC-like enzyme